MMLDAVAAAVIAGETPDVGDLRVYWQATDEGGRPKSETVAVLAALSAVGPKTAATLSFVQYVDQRYPAVRLSASDRAVNIVGTGGGQKTFNISTTAAFVAAAAGATVLKSGSSAYSSLVGSGDLLAALGMGQVMSDDCLDHMLETVGIGFAPASRYAAVCKRLAIAAMPLPFKMIGRFVNALGPLICPYVTQGSVVGVPDLTHFEVMGEAARLTDRRMMLVHSEFNVDELLSFGNNRIGWPHKNDWEEMATSDWGLVQGSLHHLQGGDVARNAGILETILKGKGDVVATQTVALNAAATLHMAGCAPTIRHGLKIALDCLHDGSPFELLQSARQFFRDFAQSSRSASG